jgi:glyoxylase-like metal-dependent hydrolase (beta-lactamase superfamily II)
MTSRIQPIPLHFELPVNSETRVPRLVHAYLVRGDDQLVLVDSGVAACHDTIVAALAASGHTPDDLAWLINTHGHSDHAGGNYRFHEQVGTPIACHHLAARWIEDMNLQKQERPVFGWEELVGGSTPVARRLEDGDLFALGGISLQVVYTPGHAHGHIALLCPEEGVLLAGDAIPPTAGLPLYSDVTASRQSLERLLTLDGVAQIYHAHITEPYTGPAAQAALREGLAYLEQVDESVRAIQAEMGDGAPIAAITRESLRRLGLAPPPVMPLTMQTIQAHVDMHSTPH